MKALFRSVSFRAIAVMGMAAMPATAVMITVDMQTDLESLMGDVGGIALFAGDQQHSGGTGVFQPFLSLTDPGGQTGMDSIERAYNAGNGNLYLDNQRNTWNSQIKLGDLQTVSIGLASYYVFALDANEPGNDKSFLSVDNIRIYTSSTDTSTTVMGNESALVGLGSLRWAMNNPLNAIPSPGMHGYDVDNYVKLDSRLDGGPAGSGLYDMLAYIPTSAFAGASATDFVWFYNLNGVHHSVDSDLAAQAGFEEWRALTGPGVRLPDGGTSVALLGVALLGLGGARRVLSRKS